MIATWLEQAEAGELGAQDAAVLACALAAPWCWPVDPVGDRRARAFAVGRGLERPSPPGLGEVALVSVEGGRAALWALERARPGHRAVRFVNVALASLHRASVVASRELPICSHPSVADAPLGARLLARIGRGRDEVLDGASFGLAFVLAAASRRLRAPVPADLVATAVVDRDGRVLPVDAGGLQQKLAFLVSHALGVRRILVADHPVEPGVPSQAAQAREFLATLGAPANGVQVVGLRDVRDALKAVFPAHVAEADAWASDDEAAIVAREVIRAALFNAPGVFGWQAVAATADRLLRRFADRPFPTSVRSVIGVPRGLELARAIALRHAGQQSAIPWPTPETLGELPRPIRLELVAHLVQSAADADDASATDFARRARGEVAPALERHAEDLKVLGAIGRAHAAAGDLEEAAASLDDALRGWLAIGRPADASYAWCELVRVQALRGGGENVDALLAQLPALGEDQPIASLGHLHLAAGRALALLGRRDEAVRDHLGTDVIDWEHTHDHVRLSALRWRAHAACGSPQGDAARGELERAGVSRTEEGRVVESDYLLLARLDAAVDRGDEGEASSVLASLCGLPDVGFESQRLASRLRAGTPPASATVLDLARAFARAYRY